MGVRRDGETRMILDAVGIQKILPHRYPFLMVDAILEIERLKRIVGVKNVTINESHFQGHFPGTPVMPGVLIIEAMAQTGGLLMSKSWNADPKGKIILFMSVDNCRFRHPVRPGDVLRLKVSVLRSRANVVKFAGQAMVGERL